MKIKICEISSLLFLPPFLPPLLSIVFPFPPFPILPQNLARELGQFKKSKFKIQPELNLAVNLSNLHALVMCRN